MKKMIVDRIEETLVVLEKEDLSHISVSVSEFDFPVSEGDILLFDGEKYIKCDDERDEKKRKILLMQQKLKEKSEKQ